MRIGKRPGATLVADREMSPGTGQDLPQKTRGPVGSHWPELELD